jgi:hypothetical protein
MSEHRIKCVWTAQHIKGVRYNEVKKVRGFGEEEAFRKGS